MSKYLSIVQLLIKSHLIYVGFFVVFLTVSGCSTVESSSNQPQEAGTAVTRSTQPKAAGTRPSNPIVIDTEQVSKQASGRQVKQPVILENEVPFVFATASANSPIVDFAKQVAKNRGLPLSTVQLLLSEARYQSTVVRLMTPPAPDQVKAVRNWQVYRQRFVEPIRIRGGVEFMHLHALTLQKAEAKYGVPAEIITAIIGVETLYGQHMGSFKVLDALSTLAFNYPPPVRPDRVRLFQDQLADLIELHVAGQLDARTQRGSFAGAIGIPQFMPGSILRYAVSAESNQRIDLSNNFDDAIMSVGNFLVEHGWVKGVPVFAPTQPPPDSFKWVDGGLTPNFSWAKLKDGGAVIDSRQPEGSDNLNWQTQMLGVIDLPLPDQDRVEYRVATPNFFALTQYNRSYFYASAVADLAEAVQKNSRSF